MAMTCFVTATCFIEIEKMSLKMGDTINWLCMHKDHLKCKASITVLTDTNAIQRLVDHSVQDDDLHKPESLVSLEAKNFISALKQRCMTEDLPPNQIYVDELSKLSAASSTAHEILAQVIPSFSSIKVNLKSTEGSADLNCDCLSEK